VKGLIPRSVQLHLRRRLIKRQGLPVFPAWPFEIAGYDLVGIAFADALLDRGVDAVRFPWFWPESATAAVTLTHDVESAAGSITPRSSPNGRSITASDRPLNIVSGLVPARHAPRGAICSVGDMRIGSHAIYHDRSLFASREAFERQLPLLREAAEQFGAVGFRSPATHRTVEWLSELPFSYDCTMPHSDPYEPIPGGTATAWPFFHGDVGGAAVHGSAGSQRCSNLLDHRDSALWQEQLEQVVACHGLFQLLTIPTATIWAVP